MMSCLTTCGAKPCETVIIMSLGSNETRRTKICPVQGIDHHMTVAQQLRINLTREYLLSPTTLQGDILDAPFSSTEAEVRLKGYLKEMGSDNGETFHDFRARCAITLALSGAELSEITDHIGWIRRHTALHYYQLAKVLNPASARLATIGIPTVTSEWNDVNVLKHFVCAFPLPTVEKRRPLTEN